MKLILNIIAGLIGFYGLVIAYTIAIIPFLLVLGLIYFLVDSIFNIYSFISFGFGLCGLLLGWSFNNSKKVHFFSIVFWTFFLGLMTIDFIDYSTFFLLVSLSLLSGDRVEPTVIQQVAQGDKDLIAQFIKDLTPKALVEYMNCPDTMRNKEPESILTLVRDVAAMVSILLSHQFDKESDEDDSGDSAVPPIANGDGDFEQWKKALLCLQEYIKDKKVIEEESRVRVET